MDYLAAVIPPLVMAVAFTAVIVTMVRNQGGANRAKEDAAVDAAASRAGRPEHPGRPERPETAGPAPRPQSPASPADAP